MLLAPAGLLADLRCRSQGTTTVVVVASAISYTGTYQWTAPETVGPVSPAGLPGSRRCRGHGPALEGGPAAPDRLKGSGQIRMSRRRTGTGAHRRAPEARTHGAPGPATNLTRAARARWPAGQTAATTNPDLLSAWSADSVEPPIREAEQT